MVKLILTMTLCLLSGFAQSEIYKWYDEEGKLYEQLDHTSALWGLWWSKDTRVRVPTGWRVESESSLLFGLLRWPSSYYVDDPAE